MIESVMNYCNNYFVHSVESEAFEIVADGITGTLRETYLVGQYICIEESFLNDGVYKITAVTSNKLTLDATLQAENTGDTIYIWGLKVPPNFVNLVNEISEYDASSTKGVQQEQQGKRSVIYGYSGSGSNSSWESVFKNQLAEYRQMYSDKVIDASYNWQNRSGCY